MSGDLQPVCLDRRNYQRREIDRVPEKCAVHDELDKWYNFRWEQQDQKISDVHRLIERLTDEMVVVRRYISMGLGFIGAVQLLPYIIKIVEAVKQ